MSYEESKRPSGFRMVLVFWIVRYAIPTPSGQDELDFEDEAEYLRLLLVAVAIMVHVPSREALRQRIVDDRHLVKLAGAVGLEPTSSGAKNRRSTVALRTHGSR